MAAVAATVVMANQAQLSQHRGNREHKADASPLRGGDRGDLGSPKVVLNLDDMRLGMDSEFGAAAFKHVSEAVKKLTADHDHVVAKLREDNLELQRKLNVALESKSAPSTVSSTSSRDGALHLGQAREPCGSDVDGVPCDEASNPAQSSSQHKGNSHKVQMVVEDTDIPEEHPDWRHRLRKIVRSGKFDSIIGAVIVANTLIMSLQLEYSGRVFKDEVLNKCIDCGVRTIGIERFFESTEHIFTGIFTFELVLRLFCEGVRYMSSASNVLDAFVVLVSMADSWVLGPLGNDAMGSVAVLRLMRLMRLAKVLRVVRVMKAFKSLRVLVAAVVNSVGALGWSMTLLFVLELVGAIFMAQVIQPFMEETTDNIELQDFIWKHFGTWTNSMFTIFEITMAPGGFIQYRRLYEEVHPLFGIFFVLYVCVVTFAVVRVITAMFLKATLSASDSDEKESAAEKSLSWSKYMRSLETMASHVQGGEGPPIMEYKDIDHLLQTEEFQEWLQDVGLASGEVARIFAALDEGTGGVLFSEFELAITQMRGQPRAADVVMNLYETRNILLRLIRLESSRGERGSDQHKLQQRTALHEAS